ncbi:hypothetical protein VCB98_13135, partial [Gammaproteobacteria bacterium AB-CW1]|nr:hypothetical protein [Gammaproteobacteria bacterium AB-CW1]
MSALKEGVNRIAEGGYRLMPSLLVLSSLALSVAVLWILGASLQSTWLVALIAAPVVMFLGLGLGMWLATRSSQIVGKENRVALSDATDSVSATMPLLRDHLNRVIAETDG